jgi:riboflavin biosynthesis pyrimidine reductase
VFASNSLPAAAAAKIAAAANLIRLQGDQVDLVDALRWMRTEIDIRSLLCEGGPTINDQLIRAGLADELFLTLAPKLKGGRTISTIMTGEGFPPDTSLPLTLISVYRDDDELYLRYRM